MSIFLTNLRNNCFKWRPYDTSKGVGFDFTRSVFVSTMTRQMFRRAPIVLVSGPNAKNTRRECRSWSADGDE